MHHNDTNYLISNSKMYECYKYVKLLCCYGSAQTKKRIANQAVVNIDFCTSKTFSQ